MIIKPDLRPGESAREAEHARGANFLDANRNAKFSATLSRINQRAHGKPI
jgi:hypothetical protein